MQIFQFTYRFFISLELRHSIFNILVCVVYTSGWPIFSFLTWLGWTTIEVISRLRSIATLEITISIVIVTFRITITSIANNIRIRSIEWNFIDKTNHTRRANKLRRINLPRIIAIVPLFAIVVQISSVTVIISIVTWSTTIIYSLK